MCPAAIRSNAALVWGESGEATYVVGNESFVLRPGVLALLPAERVVLCQVGRRAPCRHSVVHFTCATADGIPFDRLRLAPRWLAVADPQAVEQCFSVLASVLGRRDVSSYFRACAAVLELLALLMSQGRGGARRHFTAPHGKAHEALALMETHFRRPLSVKEIAQSLRITPEYLAVIFRRTFGLSPKSQIHYLRMHWANSLLLTTDKSVRELAEAAGFSSTSIFERAFRRWCGRSPDQMRRLRGHTVSLPIPAYRSVGAGPRR
jgi:AraC-like DNA-binding protein